MSTVLMFSVAAFIVLATVALCTPRTAARPSRQESSPLDEAERILARRYSRGEITFDEYERMMTLLRR